MKKTILLYSVLFFAVLLTHAQGPSHISVNNASDMQSSQDLPWLIENVLVNGGCSNVTDFTAITDGAPTDLNTKNYGYFKRNGVSSFPFAEGIVLHTGIASEISKTTSVPDFSSFNTGELSHEGFLAGDTDLEAALGLDGTSDAVSVKFTFTPTTDNISFRFIFASEEYDPQFECNFADSFAFLIREIGQTAYQNIAILPDGTPISVVNINNNDTCGINQAFFQGYDIPGTNFDGQTIPLVAKSNVTAGVAYEIKLVVADDGSNTLQDHLYDSAVFLEAGSFNLGGYLGEDLSIANNNAPCEGDIITLDPAGEPTANYTWSLNGTIIAGQTGQTLDVSTDGDYSVELDYGNGCIVTDNIMVEFIQLPKITNLSAVQNTICQNNNAVFNVQGTNNAKVEYNLNGGATQVLFLDNTGVGQVTAANTTTNQTINLLNIITEGQLFTVGNAIGAVGGDPSIPADDVIGQIKLEDYANFDSHAFLDNTAPTITLTLGDFIPAGTDVTLSHVLFDGEIVISDGIYTETINMDTTSFGYEYYVFTAQNVTNTITINFTDTTGFGAGAYFIDGVQYIIPSDGCTSATLMNSTTVNVVNSFDTSFTINSTCTGVTLDVKGNNGGVFSFNPATTDGATIDATTGIISGLVEGANYSIQYEGPAGCSTPTINSFTALITEDASFTVTPTCNGGTANINGNAGGIFSFDTTPTDGATINTSTGEVSNALAGSSYTINYATPGMCSMSSQQTLSIPDTITLSSSSGLEIPQSVTAIMLDVTATNYDVANDTVQWFMDGVLIAGETGLGLSVDQEGMYEVVVTSTFNCVSNLTFNITKEELKIIPQGISPNGDGINDTFDLTGYDVESLEVFNRNGLKAYIKTGGYTNQWRGQSKNGDMLPTGTYYYIMKLQGGEVRTSWVYINR